MAKTENKVFIGNVCSACNKEFKMEELRQEKNIFVKIDQTDGGAKWMYHSHCHKLEGGMLTLKDYLERVNSKEVAKQAKHPVENFLEKFRKTFAEVVIEEYPEKFTKTDLSNLSSIAVKWMEGCDLKKVEAENCVNWFVKDLKSSVFDDNCKSAGDFHKHYSLQNYLINETLQNLANELQKKKKKTMNNDEENCCIIIKEGLKDMLGIVLSDYFVARNDSEIKSLEDVMKIFTAWKALKDKCNHCLKIKTQTLDILTKYAER